MKRREFVKSLGAAVLAGSAARSMANPDREEAETAEEIYERSYVTDAMCFGAAPPRNYVPYLTQSKVEALRTSGITALSMCVSSGTSRRADNLFAEIANNVGKWDAFVAAHSEVFMPVRSAADLDEAKQSGKVGLIYNLQQSCSIGWNLERLESLRELGVRQIQLSYNQRNFSADGCYEKTNAGLSRYGYEVVEALGTNRILLDLSHVGERSALDAIQSAKAPMIFSHSGCYALAPHPRNVSDRNIRALAGKGGVFCVYNQSGWLTRDPVISMDHYIRHVERVIDLAGEDHVAMGTDGDPVDMTAMRPDEVARHQAAFERSRKDFPELDWDVKHMRVPELSHPLRLLHLAQALTKKGYKARTIEKIIGGNYVRVFKEVVG